MADDQTFSKTIVPPVGGWNTKDPISNMDPIYSPEILNYFPADGTVSIRNGSRKFATMTGGTSNNIRTLAPYSETDGTKWLVAFHLASGGITPYSVTTGGTVTDIGGGATFGSNIVHYANFKNLIFFKSDVDTKDVYTWNGTGNVALPGFTGPSGDDKALRRLCVYKGRLYFAGTDASIWYTEEVGAVTGALTELDLSTLFPNGGQVLYIGGLSPNLNNLREDYFVAISTIGDVLIFTGDYPESAGWNLIGTYYIGSPVGSRSFFKFQNDTLVITQSGLVSLFAVINGSPLENSYLTDNIQSVYKDLISGLSASASLPLNVNGVYYPAGNYILINMPTTTSGDFIQLVYNTINKAWTKFIHQPVAYDFTLFNNNLYYGTSSYHIFQADTGYYDEDPANLTTALSRSTKLRCAFNYLEHPDMVKIPTECVPILYESENLDLTLNCDVDYTDITSTSTNTTTGDTSYTIYKPICGLKANPGRAISIRLDGTVTTKRRSIQAFEVRWKEGDIR